MKAWKIESVPEYQWGIFPKESIVLKDVSLLNSSNSYRMLPSDTKSQNSDYGSFCQTPSDTVGNNGEPQNVANSPDHTDHRGDNNSQRQPLLPPMADDETSSDDEVGANSSGTIFLFIFENYVKILILQLF